MKTLSTILVPLLLASLMLFSNAAAEEKQDVSTFLKTISENVSFSGLIEVEGSAGKDFEDRNTSDVTLATAQFGFDAEVAPWA